jgi:hypothetical protein
MPLQLNCLTDDVHRNEPRNRNACLHRLRIAASLTACRQGLSKAGLLAQAWQAGFTASF